MGTTRTCRPSRRAVRDVDARTDVWSLGVVLYEIAAGRPPFEGATPSDAIAAILRVDPPTIAHLPPDLEDTLRKALEKDRDERHQTAKDLAADFSNACGVVSTRLPGGGVGAGRSGRRVIDRDAGNRRCGRHERVRAA